MNTKGVKAWLVTWEHLGDHAKPQNKIAMILNPRYSPDKVKDIIELFYINLNSSEREKLEYAKNKSAIPYPAEFQKINGIPFMGQITCGHNPYLYARMVTNLRVLGDDSISFNEYETPELYQT